ncbi:MAG: hypothetical protein A2161_09330 [Candidatus Schekmanbacteria bacterium RBG_13_48_7]|uniref:Uncharacterized protein n=1 Tax=Candidatus Schekmanbacteria bacterium RBG_13_48_7 TaxID=1817878 RepID=A0A1F7RZI3_9BACT|nr:MAG: hypothetical protein A2161_09330 [Candidatus Schekmanbacteria bacterium RBG_13_48_7]
MDPETPDKKIGMTDFPPEQNKPAENIKGLRLWKGLLIGCAGSIVLLVIVIILAIVYFDRHKTELIARAGTIIREHITGMMDKDIPQAKKDEFNNSIDKIIDELKENKPGHSSSQLIHDLEPFWKKFNDYQKDLRLTETETDDLLKELRKILKPVPELEPA